ncbi:component of IIS longevity pathway SMK-1-domain-containing protein [Schizothecium vesticola]|uniref:Component of IIS longevity pathway SMK-1-domain-containing protein n=1 Tax=Schizothecium vesticola TaxID=314040 RepID=A0AA40F4J2_9PEZI|nr:component of IIS longevity pathway SMK-1-domain-containing protein [Schizothecium vesticola]
MMAQPVPHQADESQTTDKKRVKVYELRSNDWFDRGTGFCSASFIPVPEGQPKEARVTVESEDQPDRLLLETKIIRDDGFQKQQDTLIVWTENDVDMALSFQEPEGCAMIWRFVDSVQQTFHGNGSGPDDGLSDDLALDMTSAIIQLPPPDLGVLPELESNMRIMSSSPNGRDALAKAIIKDDYIRKLIPLVDMAEDLESVHDLHRLCNIMKIIITLNDTNIMEHAVSDECILGVVGALEYDPDFPAHKANHRQWLSNQGRYREVVKIQDDQIDRKIHQTYRLQYLKDVVLARCLDDPTFSVLNSLIFFNQVDIVQHLQSNASLLNDLFQIFGNAAEGQLRKKEAVLFIQSCCAIAKNLQPPIRQTLYTNFLNHGLLRVINFGLRNIDVAARTGATDILVSMIDHDPQMIRHTIYRQIHEGAAPLTDTLIDLLLVEVDLGIRSQISDALKVLLDPTPPPPPEAREFVAGQQRTRVMPAVDPQQELFLLHFYENSAPKLFKPLIELDRRLEMRANGLNDGIFGHLNDILCFNIRQHGHRSRAFVVNYNLAQRYNQLLSCKEKHLQLVAIKFFRQLVTVQDEFYIRHLTEKKVLGPVLDVLLRTLPRDNLLSSACLDLFFLINKENVRELIKHLIDNYREKFQALAYIETFRQMLNSYDNNQGYTVTIDPSFWESEDDMGRRPQNMGGRGMMEHLAIDSAQEDYWNTSDDEDEHPERSGPSQEPVTNGGPLKPLVEYTSDEETDENGDAVMDPSSAALSPDDSFSATLSSAPVGPPERLSEKRRREEEDDDVLDKLVHHKRRNSSTSASSTSSHLSAAALRKKKGLGSRDSSPNGAVSKRISINISSAVKNAATALAVNASGSGGEEEA